MPSTKMFPNTAAGKAPGLQEVAELIKGGQVKNVIFLNGAGISTAAGIPDFRSPETGLYSQLEKYNLPNPQAIFDIGFFFERPEPYFTLAKELYPGNYLPTLTHYFFLLMYRKNLLKRVFTQNIDTLERLAGLPDEMLVEAHGSFATAHCMKCRKEFTAEELRPRIAKGEVLRCKETKCRDSYRGLIKSDIVFFGEALPDLFFKRLSDFSTCDLLITMGTSLAVHPFASLIDRVPSSCPRVLINLESVGEMDEYSTSGSNGMFGSYREEGFDFEGAMRGGKEFARDVRWLGEADRGTRELARLLGWEAELDEMYEAGHAALKKKDLRTASAPPTPAKSGSTSSASASAPASKDTAAASEEAEKLASKVGEAAEKPLDPAQTEANKAENEKEFAALAKELEKLDVKAGGETPTPLTGREAKTPKRAEIEKDAEVDAADKKAAL